MNKCEEMCLKWIKSQGYSNEEVIFNGSSTPDFICSDGKKYEAKKLYGDRILIYDTQVKDLHDSIIVVVDINKGVITTFPFSEIDNIDFPKKQIVKQDYIRIPVKNNVFKKLKKMKTIEELQNNKDITWDEFLLKATK